MRKGGGVLQRPFVGWDFGGPVRGGVAGDGTPELGGRPFPWVFFLGGRAALRPPSPIFPPQEDGKEVVEEPQKEEEAAAETEKAE